MARKAVRGYPEKSYYENNIFRGVHASSDPLTEGSFALISNLNINDSGKSISPRKGFLTTTLNIGTNSYKEIINLSDQTVWFRDPKAQTDIVYDIREMKGYIVKLSTYNISDNYLANAKRIQDIDHKDIATFFNTDNGTFSFNGHTLIGASNLLPIKDKDGITYYITQMKYNDTNNDVTYFLKMLYNSREDILIVSAVDFNVQTENYINRNIASNKSIIPEHFRTLNDEVTIVEKPILLSTQGNIIEEIVTSVVEEQWLPILPPADLSAVVEVEDVPALDNPLYPYGTIISIKSDISNNTMEPELSTDTVEEYAEGVLIHHSVGLGAKITIDDSYEFYQHISAYPIKEKITKPGIVYNLNMLDKSLRTTLDIEVVPSFNLQDPNIIFDKDSGCGWAYRFDILNMSEDYPDNKNSIYRTYWRKFTEDEDENPLIQGLKVEPEKEIETPIYTYYVTSNLSKFKIDNVLNAEGTDYKDPELFVYNTIKGGSNNLFTFQEAFDKLKTIVSKFNITKTSNIENVFNNDQAFFTNNGIVIYPESNYSISTDVDRVIEHSDEITSAPTLKIYTGYGCNPPAQSLTTAKQFTEHIKPYVKTHKIRFVFVPFQVFNPGSRVNILNCITFQGMYRTGLLSETNPSSISPSWGEARRLSTTILVEPDTVPTEVFYTENAFKYLKYKNLNKSAHSDHTQNLNLSLLEDIPRQAFFKGVGLVLYLKPYTPEMLEEAEQTNLINAKTAMDAWDASSFIQTSLSFWYDVKDYYLNNPTKTQLPVLDAKPSEDWESVQSAKNYTVFEDRLVLWNGNKVYISEEGDYNYFTENLKRTFPEEVLKVLGFKNILLVFTTQNLYAVYRIETEASSQEQNEDGSYKTEIVIEWVHHPVLYNINPDKKYLDVIQVFNQMILFYSNEGQLYMIQPTSNIDSDTRFSIRYFNKSANDILTNYDKYINKRLFLYGKINIEDASTHITKDDVIIKTLIDIDTIKIFYVVPNKITFILLYDVINNRYTTYDTLSFNNIKELVFTEGGEMYLTQAQGNTYFTYPYTKAYETNTNVDMHYLNAFKREPIFTLLDTGNLDLNNHLRKRLRDIKITFKNIDSTSILYSSEVFLDDMLYKSFYAPNVGVKAVNGPDYKLKVEEAPQTIINEIFGLDQTIGSYNSLDNLKTLHYLYNDKDFYNKYSLLKTETLNATKLIEYNSSVVGIGKNIRLRFQFVSKGNYKLQSFGIVYKERSL